MSALRPVSVAHRRLLAGLLSIGVLVLAIDHAVAGPWMEGIGTEAAPIGTAPGHLVVSEVMTGAASASDEFIELYNPTAGTLPLEGLEVVYVTASGATVTRKASWTTGAPGIAAGAHLLVANGAGIFAGLADVAYANGLAATGGSVALRAMGATAPIDAVGWGNAANAWLETQPAPAPPAGSSLERLPGGGSGSTQDTDDNLLDFFVQAVPDPQNSSSAPVPGATASPSPTPSAAPSASGEPTPSPSASATVTPSVEPTAIPSATPAATPDATPSPTPSPTVTPLPTATPSAPISIAAARAQPDGAIVTVEGVSLTGSDFNDGGGYLADTTAGIAVLVADGSFARGRLLRVTGTVDDRYAQRTIRATADGIADLDAGAEPLAVDATTGSVGEALEGRLVAVSGLIISSVTALSSGLAWDLDDGSGAIRVLVGTATGIDTSAWSRSVGLTLIGVVGQRDSSGTGTSGFRIQPRDASDILSVEPIPTATPSSSDEPSPTPAPSTTPSPTPIPSAPPVPISEARNATAGSHLRIRGVVTAQSGLIEAGSAVVQDGSGAILIRIGADVGTLALGQLVELDGIRATKAGMLSLRVAVPPVYLGTQAEPDAVRRTTGALGEAEEARLVIVRGAISSAITKARSGNASFSIDDGSGPLRVTISSRSGISAASLAKGSWLELRGVLGQETTGSAPSSGYRLWPRMAADLRVLATAGAGSAAASTCCRAHASPVAASSAGRSTDLANPAGGTGTRTVPVLARPQPTGSPLPASIIGSTDSSRDLPTPAGGLVVSGMGLAALAGLAAWFGRRGAPEDDPVLAEATGGTHEPAAEPAFPSARRLSVLRIGAADARKERRILPPT